MNLAAFFDLDRFFCLFRFFCLPGSFDPFGVFDLNRFFARERANRRKIVSYQLPNVYRCLSLMPFRLEIVFPVWGIAIALAL
jgi:hypothetical protein